MTEEEKTAQLLRQRNEWSTNYHKERGDRYLKIIIILLKKYGPCQITEIEMESDIPEKYELHESFNPQTATSMISVVERARD